jgi:hypothetical protein
MALDRSHDKANDVERERLRALVTRLSDKQLETPMPAGWTVAAVLAHIGFWDARAVYWIEQWKRGAEPAKPDYETREDVEWINDSAKPLCLALPPRDAAKLALQLAEESDGMVKALDDRTLSKAVEVGVPFNLSRAEHRREHLDDIDRALKD